MQNQKSAEKREDEVEKTFHILLWVIALYILYWRRKRCTILSLSLPSKSSSLSLFNACLNIYILTNSQCKKKKMSRTKFSKQVDIMESAWYLKYFKKNVYREKRFDVYFIFFEAFSPNLLRIFHWLMEFLQDIKVPFTVLKRHL